MARALLCVILLSAVLSALPLRTPRERPPRFSSNVLREHERMTHINSRWVSHIDTYTFDDAIARTPHLIFVYTSTCLQCEEHLYIFDDFAFAMRESGVHFSRMDKSAPESQVIRDEYHLVRSPQFLYVTENGEMKKGIYQSSGGFWKTLASILRDEGIEVSDIDSENIRETRLAAEAAGEEVPDLLTHFVSASEEAAEWEQDIAIE